MTDTERKYVLAIDQGTASPRTILFNHAGEVVSVDQLEHEQISPHAGWVEHDPDEIWDNVRQTIGMALGSAEANHHEIATVGITNQRETTVIWNHTTGKPVYNAIAWQDTRSQDLVDRLTADGGPDWSRSIVGETLSTYVSIMKVMWILENVPGMRERAERGELVLGNPNTWLIWNITGGTEGGVHVTDVTNTSRTMPMDLRALQWCEDICEIASTPTSLLPKIRFSSEVYGYGHQIGLLPGKPTVGDLGDRQAAAFGQACFQPGMVKNTYETDCFMLMNTGTESQLSNNGLITTICYKIGDKPTVYTLEGLIAVSSSLIQWLRDSLEIIATAPEVGALAVSVDDNDGVYFVPVSFGLFTPRWRGDACGAIVGMAHYNAKTHIARAALESTAFRTRKVLDAVEVGLKVKLEQLRVDGSMTANSLLMQFQVDIPDTEVVLPVVAETTAFGAAYAAGIVVGFWSGEEDVGANWAKARRWKSKMEPVGRECQLRQWKEAISKTLDWVDDDVK